MGGKALASQDARRVPAQVAEQAGVNFSWAMFEIARRHDVKLNMQLVPSYRQKPDFGDLDYVIDSSFYHQVSKDLVIKELKDRFGDGLPHYRNGDVLGIGYPLADGGCFQIDLINAKPEIYQASIDYFSWNDLGNLVGRIAHKLGFKYGHDGLSLVLRDGTHQFAVIPVSTDTRMIYSLLGFDYNRYLEGFDTVEDIYAFVTTSKYFNADIYNLDNRNHTARVRDRKRPVYTGFLEWLEKHPGDLNRYEFPQDKLDNLDMLFKVFPGVEREYLQKWAELDHSKYVKTRFNALLVTELTGREREDLGRYMAEFKTMKAHVLKNMRNLSDEDVRKEILAFHDWLNQNT